MAPGSFPISVWGSTTPIFMESSWSGGSAAAGHGAGGQRLDEGADVARARDPHPVAVAEDVLERPAQPANPVGPAEHERMERDRAHQGLALGLGQHLVELIGDHVRELLRGVVVPDDATG